MYYWCTIVVKETVKILLCAVICCVSVHASFHEKPVNLIIFSCDRPLQLYTLLDSIREYVTGLATITVISRSTLDAFVEGYAVVKKDFPYVRFVDQDRSKNKTDFKRLLVQTLQLAGGYCMFGVDDNIVRDHIDLRLCVSMLEKYRSVYGIYLKLGNHICQCYTRNIVQGTPRLTKVEHNFCVWQFDQTVAEWGYPHTLDMTLYRKSDVEIMIAALVYNSPNSLEAQWARRSALRRFGMCYEESRVVNIPLNIVQTDFPHNRHTNNWSAAQLLDQFNAGLMIDRRPLGSIRNSTVHIPYEPTFISRNRE
jgi:hypothetical protein